MGRKEGRIPSSLLPISPHARARASLVGQEQSEYILSPCYLQIPVLHGDLFLGYEHYWTTLTNIHGLSHTGTVLIIGLSFLMGNFLRIF